MNFFRNILRCKRFLNPCCRMYSLVNEIPEALEINVTTFQSEVIESEIPVFLVFYQDWDLISNEMINRMENLFHEHDFHSSLKLSKLNVDMNAEIADAIGYEKIPTVFAVHGQQMVGYFDETIPDEELVGFMESISEIEIPEHSQNPEPFSEENEDDIIEEGNDTLGVAEYFFLREDYDQASKIYQNLLRNEKFSSLHGEAITGLCQIELKKDPENGIDNVKELIDGFDALEGTPELKRILSSITLAERVNELSLEDEPSEREVVIKRACELAVSGYFEEALDVLFLHSEHEANVEDLKDVMVLIFDCMNPSDEALKTYRRKLMNILT